MGADDSLSWNREVSIGGLGHAKGIERDNRSPMFYFGGHFQEHQTVTQAP